jgi:hypothetical protein
MSSAADRYDLSARSSPQVSATMLGRSETKAEGVSVVAQPTGSPRALPDPAHDAPVIPLRSTVYDDVAKLLLDQGWARGAARRGDARCLLAAIDEVVGLEDTCPDGPRLARSARIGRHLRDLLGVRNLADWCDARTRTSGEILELLQRAATTYPND